MISNKGFTLLELVIYVALFAVVGGLTTGVFINSLQISSRESANTEVTQQLNFVMGAVQKLVGDASLVEAVYKTDNDVDPTNDLNGYNSFGDFISVPANQCGDTTPYCTLKLRFEADNIDPTWIVASSTGIYLVRGDDTEPGDPLTLDNATRDKLTTDKVIIDFLRFTKYELPGGHAMARMNLSLTYNTNNDKFKITRTITSAIGRVTAATFDDSLLPNVGSQYDIGEVGGLSWRNAAFSGDVTVGGGLAIAEGSAPTSATGYGKLFVDSGNKGLYFLNSANLMAPLSLNTDTKCIWLSNPTATDDLKSIWTANGFSATITKMWCESDQIVNADLQVDDGTPTDVDGTDLVCDATPAEDEAMAGDATLADGDRLDLAITSVSGTPTWMSFCWTVTYDF